MCLFMGTGTTVLLRDFPGAIMELVPGSVGHLALSEQSSRHSIFGTSIPVTGRRKRRFEVHSLLDSFELLLPATQ